MEIVDKVVGVVGELASGLKNALVKKDEISTVINEDVVREAYVDLTDPSLEDSDIISELKKKREYAKQERAPYEPQMALNRAYYVGNQWVQWNDRTNSIYVAPEQRTRITINRTRSIIRNLIAKLTRNKPVLQAVPPDSGDPSDKDAAKIAELFLDYQLPQMKYREKLQDALQWIYIEGKSYINPYFDPNIGERKKATVTVQKVIQREVFALDQDGIPILAEDKQSAKKVMQDDIAYVGEWPADENGKPIRFEDPNVRTPDDLTENDLKRQFEYAAGDIRLDVIPLHEILWEPGSLALDSARWIFHLRRQPVEAIKRNPMFKNTDKVVPDTSDADYIDYELSVGTGLYRSFYGFRQSSTSVRQNSATVYTYYQRPTAYSKGVMFCFAGEVLLYRGEIDDIPLVELKELNEPNRFVPSAIIEQIMPIQYAYNVARSQILEYVKQAIIGVWVYRKGSVDNPPTGVAGEHIEFKMDRPPERMQQPPLPSSVMDATMADKDDLYELTGLRETSRGIAAPNVTSGIQARLLVEADDSKLGPFSDLIETATEVIGNKILSLAREHFVEERIIKIAGDNRDIQVVKFMGSDLKADIKVIPGSAMSQSRIIKQQLIKENWAAGLYGNPQEPKVLRYVHKLLDDGTALPQSTIVESNILEAKRENQSFRDGLPVEPPDPWEDNEAHDMEHSEWLVSDEAIKAGRESQYACWQHIQMHREAYLKQNFPQVAQAIGGGGQLEAPPMPQQPGVSPTLNPMQ